MMVPATESTVNPAHPGHLPLRAAIFATDTAECKQLGALLLVHPAIKASQTCTRLDQVDWDATRLLFCDLDTDTEAVIKRLSVRPPTVDIILFSREEKWASRAFELDALDFLLKPVTSERLGRSIRRLLRLDWSGSHEPDTPPNQVFVPFERGRRLVAMNEICAIHAFGNYTQVLLSGGATEIVLRSLRRWEETLSNGGFIRLHRSTLANSSRIRRLEMAESGDGALAEMEGVAEKLPVSRRCLSAVRAALTAARPDPADRLSNLHR